MEIRYFLFKVFNSYRVKFLYNDCNLFRIVFKIYKTCILWRTRQTLWSRPCRC